MDRLSPDLRKAETEIDSEYTKNPLTKQPFATAVWNLLSVVEDHVFFPIVRGDDLTRYKLEALVDHFIFILRHPLYWLRISCPANGRVPNSYDPDNYEAASELINLSSHYDDFCMVFIYASRGIIDVHLEEDSLSPIHNFKEQTQYEAYNRLIKPVNEGIQNEELFAGLDHIYKQVNQSLRIRGENFAVSINPRMVRFAMEQLEPLVKQKFTLPDTWALSGYTLFDFKQVFHAISTLAYIQFAARLLAAQRGCVGLGFANALFLSGKDELINRVGRYTGLSHQVVSDIVYDLTLGSNDISPDRADPALQPLILLNEDKYAVAPHLWINNAAERNYIALINKIPTKKQIYLSLVQQKEELMRERVVSVINNSNWQTLFGRVPGAPNLPDIDLAIIDHVEKSCLLIELKWFIDPAEARELLEKGQEITKGISQLLKFKKAFVESNNGLLEYLGIDLTYTLGLVVTSANWIGHASEQHPEIPVIREYHLMKKIEITKSLSEIIFWLSERKFLPVEGSHFEIVETSRNVGKWKTLWYGIKSLIEDDEFLPV